MGGRGASSSNNSYSRDRFKNFDTAINERNKLKQKENARRHELVRQGVKILDARDIAKKEFEKEYDKIDERFRQRSLEINKRRKR